MDRGVLFDLGFLQIKWYSVCILIGMLLAGFFIYKEAKKQGLLEDDIWNLLFYGILIGILGARLYFVIFHWGYYGKHLGEIFKMWEGGLAIHGGILAGLITIIVYCRIHKIKILKFLDITVIGLTIAQAIGRWGNFFNGEAFGRVISKSVLQGMHLPKFIIQGMWIDGAYREPTFLYESVLLLIGFLVLLFFRKRKDLKVGQLTGIYLIWYGVIRIFIEVLRTDSLMLGPLKVAQVISILFIGIGGFLLMSNRGEKYHLKSKK